MSELPDFLGGESVPEAEAHAPAPEQAPAPQAPEAAPEPSPEGPPRGPDGKFAPAEPAPEPAAPAAPPADGPQPVQHVPLATFLDIRDRMTAAEKRAADAEQWRKQQEAQSRRQPLPDPTEDPAGYWQAREASLQAQIYADRVETSRTLAEIRHGEDVVKAAFDWGVQRCDQDPFFNEKVRNSRDPVGVVVAEWRREQVASKVDPSQFEAFLAWQASQQPGAPASGNPTPAAPVAAAPRPAAPRASLAAAPSAGTTAGAAPRGGEATFDAMFGP